MGPVTIDVVVSELGDIRCFRPQKKVCANAGLVPGQRESAGRTRELSITKECSRLLCWVLVQTARRLDNRCFIDGMGPPDVRRDTSGQRRHESGMHSLDRESLLGPLAGAENPDVHRDSAQRSAGPIRKR
ncbi:MAG: IS110 family transposase [Phycisphaerales bacterium]|nr:MAG: IS110 family transposase [Phycisphaerales bacterium]